MNFLEKKLEIFKIEEEINYMITDMKSEAGKLYSQEYSLCGCIGKGGYGQILKVQDQKRSPYVVKIVDKSNLWHWKHQQIQTPEDQYSCAVEYHILYRLCHTNIIQAHEIFSNRDFFLYVLEFAPGVTLYQYIQDTGQIKETEAKQFFIQIVSAISYLHSQGIAHNDIKDENLIYEDIGSRLIKIIDFGSACYHQNIYTREFCGSEDYASPEVVQMNKYSLVKQDIWSLGILLYIMLTGESPFCAYKDLQVDNETWQHTTQTRLTDKSQELLEVMKGILSLESERWSLHQIINSSWIRKS